MDKFIKNVIFIIGFILCTIVFLLNSVFIAQIADDLSESVDIKLYGILNLGITILIAIGLSTIFKKIEKIDFKKVTKITIVIIFIAIYVIGQICWINLRDATPVADQKTIYDIAEKMYNHKWEDLKNERYLELCPQQITLSFCYSIIFRIFNIVSVKLVQYINIIANLFTVIALFMITKLIGTNYKINKTKTVIISLTFFPLPLLSTFIYGDILGLPFVLWAVYFCMKYATQNKKYNIFISAVLMAIAYMLRMNNLIVILALVIYLFMDILNKKNGQVKEVCFKSLLMLFFIIISFAPATITKRVIQHKLGCDREGEIPTVLYISMGMEEGSRSNGWFNSNAAFGWDNPREAKNYYKDRIVERVKYLITNPLYTLKFYAGKTASMWTENTYASLWYNQTFNFSDVTDDNAIQIDYSLTNKTEKLQLYQKALILIIFGTTILVLITNRKELSNEVLLLINIFIGGFLFQTLWEAKSRYIISYIIILIPVASICIDEKQLKIPLFIKKRQEKGSSSNERTNK